MKKKTKSPDESIRCGAASVEGPEPRLGRSELPSREYSKLLMVAEPPVKGEERIVIVFSFILLKEQIHCLCLVIAVTLSCEHRGVAAPEPSHSTDEFLQ